MITIRRSRNFLKSLTFFWLLCALAIGTTGCTNAGAVSSKTLIFVEFDGTGVAQDPAIRRQYFNDFARIVNACKGGELLAGDSITGNSLATARYPLNVQFPIQGDNTAMMHEEALSTARKAALKQGEQCLLVTNDKGTTLMDSQETAAKVFNGEMGQRAASKYLIILSDMIEQSTQYDFTSMPLGKQRVKAITDTERAAHRLPNLRNVTVWVAGAGASRHNKMEPGRMREIETFWIDYFTACGACLTAEHYAPVLLNFIIPSSQEPR